MTRKIWAVVVVATAFGTVVTLLVAKSSSVEAFSFPPKEGSDRSAPPTMMLPHPQQRGSSCLEPSAWTTAAYSSSPSCRRDCFLGILATASMMILPPTTSMTASAVGEGSERMVLRQAPVGARGGPAAGRAAAIAAGNGPRLGGVPSSGSWRWQGRR